MQVQPRPSPAPAMPPPEQIDRARRALDALSCLVGSANDLHIVPADGLAALLDLIVRELPAD
jgi:hypothetical protein